MASSGMVPVFLTCSWGYSLAPDVFIAFACKAVNPECSHSGQGTDFEVTPKKACWLMALVLEGQWGGERSEEVSSVGREGFIGVPRQLGRSRLEHLLWQVSSWLQVCRGVAASHANLLAWTATVLLLRLNSGSHRAQLQPCGAVFGAGAPWQQTWTCERTLGSRSGCKASAWREQRCRAPGWFSAVPRFATRFRYLGVHNMIGHARKWLIKHKHR